MAEDLSKCSDGAEHVLYAIEVANWVEEVGCERCTLKIVGKKWPGDPPQSDASAESIAKTR